MVLFYACMPGWTSLVARAGYTCLLLHATPLHTIARAFPYPAVAHRPHYSSLTFCYLLPRAAPVP